MKALFTKGDVVNIRLDIKDDNDYKMRSEVHPGYDYLMDEMAPPGAEVKIRSYVESHGNVIGYLLEEPYSVFTYTDDMFNQDAVEYLYYNAEK